MGFLGELFAMFLLVLVVVHKVKMKAPSELITTKAEKVAIVKGEKNYSRIRESGQRLLLLVCYRRRSHLAFLKSRDFKNSGFGSRERNFSGSRDPVYSRRVA